ncbi:lytic murein transglycosylase [Desulfogranum mediterraneum]|uniref:lytic murein transglycosylase n=1 Tax=Desulfogranum mediterraneum TaxID=160661 RepID=UPI0004137572|nr:lytic murein transglycosylase [Desulfogranum mediterraneum]
MLLSHRRGIHLLFSRGLLLALLLSLGAISAWAAAKDAPEAAGGTFRQWLTEFYPLAAEQGVSAAVYSQAFAGVREPDTRVLEKARYQPEFTTKIWDYLDARVTPLAIQQGQQLGNRHARTLAAIKARFGVRPSVLLAIWSMESNYGAILTRTKRLHAVPRALATLAYADPRRQKFGRSQLLAALQILQAGDISAAEMLGSWAGAMGHTQFIPSSYLAYGVDLDGDGRRDIWNSIPDALATAANLLAKNNWQSGKTWGYEAVAPPGDQTGLVGTTKTLAQWEELGFRRPQDQAFPRPQDRAVLKLPAGPKGPAFLMLKNFFVIKRYNNSDFYALAVGMLADRIAGYPPLVQPWPRPPWSLTMTEKYELQQLLKKRGFYQGVIDGAIGSASRRAIRAFQQQAGLAVEGKPSRDVLRALRRQPSS